MSDSQPLRAELPPNFDLDSVEWVNLTGSPAFDYPIDYGFAVLSADRATGRLDLLSRWAPNAYCHYHRHVCKTAALVIDGEQHVIETRGLETVHKIRQPGFSGPTPDNETHMERAGPTGCTMLFAMQSDDGRMFEILSKDGKVLATATLDDFLENRIGRSKAA
jgi:hypothetical protein